MEVVNLFHVLRHSRTFYLSILPTVCSRNFTATDEWLSKRMMVRSQKTEKLRQSLYFTLHLFGLVILSWKFSFLLQSKLFIPGNLCSTKPGLWTPEWTVDWSLESIMETIIGLAFLVMWCMTCLSPPALL